MYRVMVLTKNQNGRTNGSRQVGREVPDLQTAIKRAHRLNGYVIGPDKHLKGQAMNPDGPRFIRVNIASGEDSYAVTV